MAYITHPELSNDTEPDSGSALANGRIPSMRKETLLKPYNDWPNDPGVSHPRSTPKESRVE